MVAHEYARAPDGAEIAYAVLSDTPGPTILYVPGFLYPIEAMEDDPPYARFLHGLGSLGRLVAVERRGIGASDPIDWDSDVFAIWADDVVRVIDALELERATLMGVAAGAVVTIRAAAMHPDRVESLVVMHAPARADVELEFEGIAERMQRVVARDDQASRDLLALTNPSRAGDPGYAAWNERAGRLGASPKTAAAFWQVVLSEQAAIAPYLDAVVAPTLVLHRETSQLVPPEWSAQLADVLTDGRLVLLPGADLTPNSGDGDAIVAEVAAFLTGEHRLPDADRPVRALLFTDLVGSTTQLSEIGDEDWRRLLDRHDAEVRRALGRHGGVLVKATGDGALATFETATRALQGAVELRHAIAGIGLRVRMGVHIGEVDRRGDDVAGTAVHLAARVMGAAGDGEIVTSAAVPIVTAGGSFGFESLGTRELKGLDGHFELFRVVDPPA